MAPRWLGLLTLCELLQAQSPSNGFNRHATGRRRDVQQELLSTPARRTTRRRSGVRAEGRREDAREREGASRAIDDDAERATASTQGAPASPPPVAGGSRAAILLTGHVRTFDLTAPTLNEFLVQANPGYAFSLFCSTYREREAVSIRSRQGPTEQKSLDEDELYVPYTSFIPRDRFHAELHRPFDIKRGLPFFNPQRAKTLSKNQTKNSGYRNYLRRMRHSSMFELIKRGYEMIERQAEIYHVVVKFRFDLGLKALLVINRGWVERGLVVMPVRIADGGAGIQPRVLATRPCSTDGSGKKRPSWVQDHVGYASPGTFRKFAVNVQRYNLRHTSPQKAGVARTPEYTLAGSLKEQKVDLTCDPTIQYTVKRRYLERPGQRFKKKKNGKLALTPEAHALKQ